MKTQSTGSHQTILPTGRDENGVPPVVGLGDGTITKEGHFLSDEDTAKLREAMKAQNPIVDLPDGSLRITLPLPPEIAIPLTAWAEGCSEDRYTYICNFILTALTAAMLSDAVM